MIVCTKCRKEPRDPGQRWGRACFADYMRNYRRKTKTGNQQRTNVDSST